jgi:predicted patatin/cPLA2 family phospholipase
MKTLIVISGGGFAQIESGLGVLKAMDELGLISEDTDYKGTSAGAIVACAACEDLKAITDEMLDTKTSDLITKRWFYPFKLMLGKSIYDRSGMVKKLKKLFGDKLYENVTAIATRLPDMKRVEMPGTVQAMLASSAIDGIFPNVKIYDFKYIDGGYTDNVPIECNDLKIYSKIYIILCPQEENESRHYKTLIGRFLKGMSSKLSQELNEAERIYSKEPNVEVLRPFVKECSLLSWSKDFKVFEQAYSYTKKRLAL